MKSYGDTSQICEHRDKAQWNPDDPIIQRYERVHGLTRPSSMSVAPLWKQFLQVLPYGKISAHDRIMELLKGIGGTLLDVGCGRGDLLLRFSGQFTELVGCDFSRIFLEQAKAGVAAQEQEGYCPKGKIELILHDLNKPLPFDDDSFDVVTAIALLEHVFDPYFVCREVNRVLKSRGILIVQVPNIGYIRHRVRLLFGRPLVTQLARPDRWSLEGYDGGHIHYFTLNSLRLVLRDCGFDVTKYVGSGTLASLRSIWVSLCSGDLFCQARSMKPLSFSGQKFVEGINT